MARELMNSRANSPVLVVDNNCYHRSPQVINSAVAPEVETEAASVGEVVAAVAGLVATGVVAWSLATLKDTGDCAERHQCSSAASLLLRSPLPYNMCVAHRKRCAASAAQMPMSALASSGITSAAKLKFQLGM